MVYQICLNIVLSFLSSITFGVISNVPRKSLLTGGFVGTIGWLGFWGLSLHHAGIFISSFVCSLLLALAAQVASRVHKMPLIVFYIPGLVPVVPGISSYEAFRALLTHHYSTAMFGFINVCFSAVGITCGLVAADIVMRLVFSYRMVGRRAP
ncbi:threonine/serine exporter family protein [Alicyclobacillus fastidiosus]|uniref:Threonine/serine exporter family protein n=1 Tax=Alicyclobacillus fastidiosus TaxID=392011 RepID=A0ABY6ZI31_9BACL|nr:threonine/serine exporter family protein [Alicyclobacillus fastidiosus]WAH42570.1 threonine/serine exporter family protein [Alicyclobacillus fastidiosus]GMA64425.1 membrane protein [Alicyclobacillus fastidiosus]